jgi:hypothetical protein
MPRSRAIPSVKPKRRKKKSNRFLYQGLAISALTVVSAGYLAYQQSAEAEAARVRQEQAYQDSIARAQARLSAVSSRGKLVFTGLPSNARLNVAGRVFVPGVVDSMEPGRYVAEARAAGYRDLSREIMVTAGQTDTIVMTMSLAVASQPTQTTREPTKAAPPVKVDTSEVRLAVFPIHAEIFVNGRSVGKGRARDRLATGSHTVRYQAVGCVPEEATISVSDGRPLVVPPRTLNCQ